MFELYLGLNTIRGGRTITHEYRFFLLLDNKTIEIFLDVALWRTGTNRGLGKKDALEGNPTPFRSNGV